MLTADSTHFVLKRAFRLGRVTRADVRAAYPELGYSTAGLVLRRALSTWPLHLCRNGRSVVPLRRQGPPDAASEGELMRALETGRLEMRYTGFRPEELPMRQVRWVASQPPKSGVLTTIARAIGSEQALELRYVGLRLGESARWRPVYPLGLEQMAQQWRLVAQCLETPGYPVKVFVLSRIFDAAEMAGDLPGDFFAQTDDDRELALKVVFDRRLTEDQKTALSNEFNLQQGRIRLPQRARWEFERQMGHADPHEHVIWPPIEHLEDD